jgi:hypothetical protein
MLGDPQSRSGYCGEDKNLFSLPGIDLKIPWSSNYCTAPRVLLVRLKNTDAKSLLRPVSHM